jgi:hypothetical protein
LLVSATACNSGEQRDKGGTCDTRGHDDFLRLRKGGAL